MTGCACECAQHTDNTGVILATANTAAAVYLALHQHKSTSMSWLQNQLKAAEGLLEAVDRTAKVVKETTSSKQLDTGDNTGDVCCHLVCVLATPCSTTGLEPPPGTSAHVAQRPIAQANVCIWFREGPCCCTWLAPAKHPTLSPSHTGIQCKVEQRTKPFQFPSTCCAHSIPSATFIIITNTECSHCCTTTTTLK